MDNKTAIDALESIIRDIEERKAEADVESHDDFTNGRKLAYFEVLDMIYSRVKIFDIPIHMEEPKP